MTSPQFEMAHLGGSVAPIIRVAEAALDRAPGRSRRFGPEDYSGLVQLACVVGFAAKGASLGDDVDYEDCASRLLELAAPLLAASKEELRRLVHAFRSVPPAEKDLIAECFKNLGAKIHDRELSFSPVPRQTGGRINQRGERRAREGHSRKEEEPAPATEMAPIAAQSAAASWKDRLSTMFQPARSDANETARVDKLLMEFVVSLQAPVEALRYDVGNAANLTLCHGLGARSEWRLRRSETLDIRRTIERTIETGGFFRPVRQLRRYSIDYVFVIKRLGPGDHEADRCRSLIAPFHDAGSGAAVYYYDGDLSECYELDQSAGSGRRLSSLWSLRDAHPTARLVIFSDGGEFLSPDGSIVSSHLLNALFVWPERCLATPRSYWEWYDREAVLAREAGLSVVLASSAGLIDIPTAVRVPGTLVAPQANVLAAPSWVSSWPGWVYLNEGIDDEIADQAYADIVSYLGEDGEAWIMACSLYPELRPQLTVALGQEPLVADGDGKMRAVYSRELFARLARLPWFRLGVMPHWLERRLKRSFDDRFGIFLKAYHGFKLSDAAAAAAVRGGGLQVSVGLPSSDAAERDLRVRRRSVTLAELSTKATRAVVEVEPELRRQIEYRRSAETAARDQRKLKGADIVVADPRLANDHLAENVLSLYWELQTLLASDVNSTNALRLSTLRDRARMFASLPEISDRALARLTLAVVAERLSLHSASSEIDDAVAELRRSGRMNWLPAALLLRVAHRRRRLGDGDAILLEQIRADLAEIDDIAGEEMRLYRVDYELVLARLALEVPSAFDTWELAQADAHTHLTRAADLITETGYHLRDAELAEVRANLVMNSKLGSSQQL